MTTTASKSRPAWQAEVNWEKRHYVTEEEAPADEIEETAEGAIARAPEKRTVEVLKSVTECFVHVFRPGCERIRFRVNHRPGQDITFSDPRGRNAGTAGVTGIWGTLPAPPVDKPRPLSRSAFRVELARLIGAERAGEIVQTLSDDFFCTCI